MSVVLKYRFSYISKLTVGKSLTEEMVIENVVINSLIPPLRLGTPFLWLYWPVRMLARLGEQMELLQQTLVKRMPSAARRSMVGVGQYFLSHESYAPMASEAWSSDMMKRILGSLCLASRLVPARMPSWHAKVIRMIFSFFANEYIY